MNFWNFFSRTLRLPTIFQYIVKALDASGMFGLGERIYRTVGGCHPLRTEDPCNTKLALSRSSAAVGLMWLDSGIRSIPFVFNRNSGWYKAPDIWNFAADILNMCNFYLYFYLALYVDYYGREKEMDDYKEFLPITLFALFSAVITNQDMRNTVANCTHKTANFFYRGYQKKCERLPDEKIINFGSERNKLFNKNFRDIYDRTADFWLGFANGRGLAEVVERVVDAYAETKFYYSPPGAGTRYLTGIFWGILNSWIGAHAALPLNAEIHHLELQQAIIKSKAFANDSIISLAVAGLLIRAMSQIEDKNTQLGLSIGLSTILIPILLRACCTKEKKDSKEAKSYPIIPHPPAFPLSVSPRLAISPPPEQKHRKPSTTIGPTFGPPEPVQSHLLTAASPPPLPSSPVNSYSPLLSRSAHSSSFFRPQSTYQSMDGKHISKSAPLPSQAIQLVERDEPSDALIHVPPSPTPKTRGNSP